MRSNTFFHPFFAYGLAEQLRSRSPDSRNSPTLPDTRGPAPRRLVLYDPFSRTLCFLRTFSRLRAFGALYLIELHALASLPMSVDARTCCIVNVGQLYNQLTFSMHAHASLHTHDVNACACLIALASLHTHAVNACACLTADART